MHQVFISYNRADRHVAEQIHSFLVSHEITVWQDTYDLRGGELYHQKIADAIHDAAFFIVILSSHSVKSAYVMLEIQIAMAVRTKHLPVTIVPVLIEDVEIPNAFSAIHVLRLTYFTEEGLRGLLDALSNERIVTLLDNPYLQINMTRRGSPFDRSVVHPVQAAIFGGVHFVFVLLIHSVGDKTLSAEATSCVRRFAGVYTSDFWNIITSQLEDKSQPITTDLIFLYFFKLLNQTYRKEVIDAYGKQARVFTDVTLVLLIDGKIFMRNAGASGGVVKAFNGVNAEGSEVWLTKGMTGNIAGDLHNDELFQINVTGYPIGRFEKITDASPMGLVFSKPKSIAAIATFKIAKEDVERISPTLLVLDTVAMARTLIELLPPKWQKESSNEDLGVLTIESRGISNVYMDPSPR